MTVYADVLVIVNLYIDFILLRCVKNFLALRVKDRRLALGAAIGAVCSLTALLPVARPVLSLLLGAVTSLAVTAGAFAPLRRAMFFRAALCFWAFSMALAGFFLFLLRFFAPEHIAVLGSVVYFDLSLPLLFLFTCGAYAVFALAQRILPGRSQSAGCCYLTVEHAGRSVRLFAKADTGNALREPFSGLPVVVCQAESLSPILPQAVRSYLETGEIEDDSAGLRVVPYESLGGAGLLPAFRPEKITVEKTGQVLACWAAVCKTPLSAGQYDALYHPDLLQESLFRR